MINFMAVKTINLKQTRKQIARNQVAPTQQSKDLKLIQLRIAHTG